MALTSKLLVITGGPGTGKTTLVEAILAGLEDAAIEVQLAAPTGRAARRLGESTGRDAKTLHRLLEAEPGRGFRRGAERPLSCGLLVVDEMSMVDVPLMQAMLAALPTEAALILVGDVDQLPSIGPGPGAGRPDRLGPPAGRPPRARSSARPPRAGSCATRTASIAA